MRRRWFALATALLGALLVLLLALPTVALFVTVAPPALLAGFRHPIAAPALVLSLGTTAVSLLVVVL